jgi:hypothetical protein
MFSFITILVSLLMIKLGLCISVKYPRLSDVLGITGTIILMLIITSGVMTIFNNSSDLN